MSEDHSSASSSRPPSRGHTPRSSRIDLLPPGIQLPTDTDEENEELPGSMTGQPIDLSQLPEDWGHHQGSRFGLDIGGTLTKLIFFDTTKRPSWCDGTISEFIKEKRKSGEEAFIDEPVSLRIGDIEGTFYFMVVQTKDLETWILNFIQESGLSSGIESIYTAGGGAWKHAQNFKDDLGVRLKPVDELGVVVRGISFMVARSDKQLFVCDNASFSTEKPLVKRYYRRIEVPGFDRKLMLKSIVPDGCGTEEQEPLFPFLLCNIGTGVSIVEVNGENDFLRVSGTAIGGGTFWGLTQLLTKVKDFDDAMELASAGSAQRLHLLVKDIYGGDYNLQGGGKLPGTLTASFFGKPLLADNSPTHSQNEDAAICRGLITMIAQNVVQIAWLNAKLRRIPRVVFTGNFLRHNSIAMRVIAHNMYLMNGSFLPPTPEDVGHVKAMFLRHEGYFGAMGSFLNNLPVHESNLSFHDLERVSRCHTAKTDRSLSISERPLPKSPTLSPDRVSIDRISLNLGTDYLQDSVRLKVLRQAAGEEDDFQLPSPEASREHLDKSKTISFPVSASNQGTSDSGNSNHGTNANSAASASGIPPYPTTRGSLQLPPKHSLKSRPRSPET